MKTFFFTCRNGEKGSIEDISLTEAVNFIKKHFGKDIIKIEEMEEL